MTMKKIIFLLSITSILFSCSNSDNNSGSGNSINVLNVTTNSIYDIHFTSAKCIGSVSSADGSLQVGFCWSTMPNPTTANQHSSIPNNGAYSFIVPITSLSANTTYYVRAYATNNNETVYGNQITFSTLNMLSYNGSGVTDIEGENYSSIILNGKEWMKKNLDVSKYRNGDVIPQVTDPAQWESLTTGAWCYYENDSSNGPIYGKLYNWYAVNDPRGLAPQGWHIPTDSEWTDLANYLGGDDVAGKKLKDDSSSSNWDVSTNYATNQSGFTALPSGVGYLNYNIPPTTVPTLADLFKWKTKATYWWSATTTSNSPSNNDVWVRNLNNTQDVLARGDALKTSAISVRCIKN